MSEIRPIDANSLAKKACAYPDFMVMLGSEPVLSLNTLRDEIYSDAVAHGLWEEARYVTPAQMGNAMYAAARILADEVAELKDEAVIACTQMDREHQFPEELMDVLIAGFSIAGHFHIDVDAQMRRKMEINKARPWKHGKE